LSRCARRLWTASDGLRLDPFSAPIVAEITARDRFFSLNLVQLSESGQSQLSNNMALPKVWGHCLHTQPLIMSVVSEKHESIKMGQIELTKTFAYSSHFACAKCIYTNGFGPYDSSVILR
jgi:hypothetical protein